jgi:hypothetical protein
VIAFVDDVDCVGDVGGRGDGDGVVDRFAHVYVVVVVVVVFGSHHYSIFSFEMVARVVGGLEDSKRWS